MLESDFRFPGWFHSILGEKDIENDTDHAWFQINFLLVLAI